MGLDAKILVFWMLNFKPTLSHFSFTFFKRLFSSSLLSAIRWCYCISEVIDICPGNLDSSLCFIQPSILHDALCILKVTLKSGREGEDRGWDGWMALPIWWTLVEKALGVGDGQGSLACCSPWGHKESDMTQLLNWIELNSAYKLNQQGDNIQPWRAPFPVWNQMSLRNCFK